MSAADEMGWPDKDRPGVPRNPEVDGWHWIAARSPTNPPRPREWVAAHLGWATGDGVMTANTMARGHGITTYYLGPVRTEADLRAASAASFMAGVEAAERAANDAGFGGTALTNALRSLPIPDASALGAALERARQEEREAIYKMVDSFLMLKTKLPAEQVGQLLGDIRARTPKTGELTNG